MKTAAPFVLAILLLAACGEKPAEKKGAPPTLITTTEARAMALEVSERTVGVLQALIDPKVSAEIAGKVVRVGVRAGETVKKGQFLAQIDPDDAEHLAAADRGEIARLSTLLAQQEKTVARQSELLAKNFVSKNALDDVTAQRDALKNQLATARARGEMSRGNVAKTRVVAPTDGVVEVQIVSPGDYVKVGDGLFQLVSNARLRAHLPYPESAGPRIRLGMPVRLASPLAPELKIEGVVEDIRPTISEGSRAIDVIARINNPGPLKSGGSLDAAVITGQKPAAIVVPEQSVVLRPAGKVVYRIVDGKAVQQLVDTGSKQQGVIEILKGLQGGETVALDGAGFLSNGAAVNVKNPPKSENSPGEAKAK